MLNNYLLILTALWSGRFKARQSLRNASHFAERSQSEKGVAASCQMRRGTWCPEPGSNRHAIAGTGF